MDYKPGQSVKVDGSTYKIVSAVEGYLVVDQYGYETMLTTGQLDAGKRTVIPGTAVDMSSIDLKNLTASDKAHLRAALKAEAGIGVKNV